MIKRALNSNLKKRTQVGGAAKESGRLVSSHVRLRLFLVAALLISLIPFNAITAVEADNPESLSEATQSQIDELVDITESLENEDSTAGEGATDEAAPDESTVYEVEIGEITEGMDAVEADEQPPIEITPMAAYVIDLSAPASIDGVTYGGTTLTFSNQANDNEYTLIQTGSSQIDNIVFLTDVVTTVTLDGIDIEGNIDLLGNADITLLLSGYNNIDGSIIVPVTNAVDVASITIDSAATSGSTIGSLTVTAPEGHAAIGGGLEGSDVGGELSAGNITFNGGTINAIGGDFSAGIGGDDGCASGKIVINGGDITAYGSEFGAGIGGGSGNTRRTGNVQITGGVVYAQGGEDGAGIGGSYASFGSNVTISGGDIFAIGGGNSPGIGGGNENTYVDIVITDGTIIAEGGFFSAGIGGGATNTSVSVEISGGEITARGNFGGPGIGIGPGSDDGTVIITGGEIIAEGGNNASGIGCGWFGANNTVTITNGDITAKGGSGGAGIGGSQYGEGGPITITGGEIIAIGGSDAAGIGGGQDGAGANITIDSAADIKAYSSGKAAIEAVGNNQGNGFYVNGEVNGGFGGTDSLIVFAEGDRTTPLKTLDTDYSYFAFTIKDASNSANYNIRAYDGTTAIGSIVRFTDDDPQIYSINTLNGYTAYNGNVSNGLLPVYLLEDPIPEEIDLSETTGNGPGYTVSGTSPKYSDQYTDSYGGPTISADRVLTFTSEADGQFYRIVQSGIRDSSVAPGRAKIETSLFNEIIIPTGITVTLILESIDFVGNINVQGTGNLILLLDEDTTNSMPIDSPSSFVTGSIIVPKVGGDTASITIDSATTSGSSDGLLEVNATASGYAAIGGGNEIDSGNVTIAGGTIKVQGEESAAGIGGGYLGDGGTITISGGTINAQGGFYGAGIGGGDGGWTGWNTNTGGIITITGGTINAQGGNSGSGIGGGNTNIGGSVTILGGTINATGGEFGSGVGGGNTNTEATVTISGGTVDAIGGSFAAGIGGGNTCPGGTIIIDGGKVSAVGSLYAAGIGGGRLGDPATITIGAQADLEAYSLGQGKQAIDAQGDISGDGFYVNAQMIGSYGGAESLIIFADDNWTVPLKTIDASHPNFAFTIKGAQSSKTYNILANDSSGPVGVIVRDVDDSLQIYSINELSGYNEHNYAPDDGLLPVRLGAIIPGVPSVTDISYTSADFHSNGQWMFASATYISGGFRYSTLASVNPNTRMLIDPETTDMLWDSWDPGEIITHTDDLAENTTYYLQTWIETSMGIVYSMPVQFTTRSMETIDLSETITSGNGYTVGGTSPRYSSIYGSNPGGPAPSHDRTLTFEAAADGQTYRIVQSGLRSPGTNPLREKELTSIFGNIFIKPDIHVTLILESIDLFGAIGIEGTGNLTLLLGTDTTYLPSDNTTGSFITGSIIAPTVDTDVSSLTIDSEASPETGSSIGSITVESYIDSTAAIGAQVGLGTGIITIKGGTVIANGSNGSAGIGNGTMIDTSGTNTITISGGTVIATGGSNAAGIGSGAVVAGMGSISNTITISGGTVVATGGANGAGIGGGYGGAGGTITINGGKVTAIGGNNAAGIGGGNTGAGANLTIGSGADVDAYANNRPAIHAAGNVSGGGFYVNAQMNGSYEGADSLTVYEGINRLSPLKTLNTDFIYFGFTIKDDQASKAYNIAAYNGSTPVGSIVRVEDDGPQIYSINSLNGYNAYNGNANNGVLPVKLMTLLAGIPSVSNITLTTADFHSNGHWLAPSINYVSGGFLYSTNPTVALDNGQLTDPGAITVFWDSWNSGEITKQATGLAEGTTYYMQTWMVTTAGVFYSEPVQFTTKTVAGVIDLSETLVGGVGYTVQGTTPKYSDSPGGPVLLPGRILTFTAAADGEVYRIVQSGIRSTGDYSRDKEQTSIFDTINISDGIHVTLIVESIDLVGKISALNNGELTLLLGVDATNTLPMNTTGNFVNGSIIAQVERVEDGGGTGSLTIDSAVEPGSGSLVGSLTVITQEGIVDAAIGGLLGRPAGNITIQGGTIYAESSNGAAGIGGGSDGSGGTITITGGKVTAVGSELDVGIYILGGSGIGGGYNASGGTITITGGEVIATGGFNGAGIGGGMNSDSGTISISGGTVVATGGADAAGIGSGNASFAPGSITITGGNIIATGGSGVNLGGAGIGGGANSASPSITIGTDAVIKAYSENATSKPAIDGNSSSNNGDGYYINKYLSAPLSEVAKVDIYVFTDGYSGSNLADNIGVLELPATYCCFAYTCNDYDGSGDPSYQNVNLYADLGYNSEYKRDDVRVIEQVSNNSKQIPYVDDNAAIPVKLRELPEIPTPSATSVTKTSALLLSTNQDIQGHTYVSGGFRYSTTLDGEGDLNGTIATVAWTDWAFDLIVEPTGSTALAPNTRYYLTSYYIVNADLWFGVGLANMTFESTPVPFATPPDITNATAVKKDNESANISATFSGGNRTINSVVIYWDTDPISLIDPSTAAYSKTLSSTEYTINGFSNVEIGGTSDPMVTATYNIVIQIVNQDINYDLYQLTYDHSAAPQINVSVPVKLIFAAFESDKGDITSPNYYITNNGETDVEVTLKDFTVINSAGLTLVGNPVNPNEISLYCSSNDTTPMFTPVNLASPTLQVYLGDLSDGSVIDQSNVMAFRLTGRYAGEFVPAKVMLYNIVFEFEAVEP